MGRGAGWTVRLLLHGRPAEPWLPSTSAAGRYIGKPAGGSLQRHEGPGYLQCTWCAAWGRWSAGRHLFTICSTLQVHRDLGSAHVGERQVQCVYGHASAALSLAVVCRDARVWQPLALPAWGSAVLHLCAGAAQPLMRSMCTSRGAAQRCSSFRCLQLRYACVVIEHRRVWECAELAHVLCLIVGMF